MKRTGKAPDLEASRRRIMGSLYEATAREDRPPEFLFVPETPPSTDPADCPDVILAVLQLYRWAGLRAAEITALTGAERRKAEAILARLKPTRQPGHRVPLHVARKEPADGCTPHPYRARPEVLRSAVSYALGLGLSPQEVALLYGFPPRPEVYASLERDRPATAPYPADTQRRCRAFFRDHLRNPNAARSHLDGAAREALRRTLEPAFELQAANFAWVEELLAGHLPAAEIRRRGPEAAVLVLGHGDARELFFLRKLLPEARLIGVDREITPQAVLNEIQTGALLIEADFAHLSGAELTRRLGGPPAAVVARHAFAIDPAVPRTCAWWADEMARTGGAFLATTYMNFERALLEDALRRRRVAIRTAIYAKGARHGEVLPGSGSRSDHFTLTLSPG